MPARYTSPSYWSSSQTKGAGYWVTVTSANDAKSGASHLFRFENRGLDVAVGIGLEKRCLRLGVRRVSRGGCRRWKLMLNLLYLLSLMGLRPEDFVRDSEEVSTHTALDTFSPIPSGGPVPKRSQTGWHPEYS